MIKDQSFLDDKASYCIDSAKKNGATDVQVSVGNSVSETVNFRNKKLDESERSDTLILNLTTFINKRKSTISSSNIENNNLDIAKEDLFQSKANFLPSIALTGTISETDTTDIKLQSGVKTSDSSLNGSSKSIILSLSLIHI